MYRTQEPETSGDGVSVPGPEPSTAKRVQHRLMALHRHYGTSLVVLGITIGAVGISLVCTGLAMWVVQLAGNMTRERLVTSMMIGLFVPAIVAPTFSQLLVGLLAELDEANTALSIQSRTDALTNVLNRRGFFEAAQPLLSRVPTIDVLLCMVDVNHFKQLNDEFGHDVGDRALLTLAERMTEVVGPEGFVGRLGGDEFALVIPGRSDSVLFRSGLVETFRSVQVPNGPVVSASCGVTLVLPGDSLDGALTRADGDLYQEKAARRGAPIHVSPRSASSEDTLDLRELWLTQPQGADHRPRHRRD